MRNLRIDTMTHMGCLDEDEIVLYIAGTGGEQLATRVFLHVDRCSDCRELVASLARTGDEASDASASGPRVGRFILRNVLGEGAMGIVYLAYDPQLKRHVAVKLLRPDIEHPGADERFVIEAQTAAQLSHPNAVVVYDAGNHEGQPYVAMEYVEGLNAADWLRRGGVSWQAAIEVMLAAGEGLAAAHRAGLVHRDFKPANVLLGSDGRVKVTDFGLAQFDEKTRIAIAAHEDALNIPRRQRHVTQTGVLVGTPAYTSPEQYAGNPATTLSDQYAFAVTLYSAVYGRRPFRGKTPYELYQNVLTSEPPAPAKDSPVPLAIWPVIARALAKEPGARFETMDALLVALRQAVGNESGSGKIDSGDSCPFPGLSAFGEEEAGFFFGRDRELGEFMARIRESGSACVVGPSGAGKSSFVRALAIPRLRQDDPMCEVLWLRPGAHPFEALARLVGPLTTGDTSFQPDELANWLRRDPSRLAGMLLSRARHYNTSIILFVDQLEELFAQVTDPLERASFADCIALVGADPNRPLRLITSLRSDFLDRAGESAQLMTRITTGFLFLAPPRRESLIEAIAGPLHAVGYALEDAAIASQLADELSGKPGAFPLLQFVAGRLWDDRDRKRRVITRASLESMGALAGALATHADAVLASLTNSGYRLARAVLLRLVTPEGTKQAVDMDDLAALTSEPTELERVVEIMVKGRLLIAERRMETRSPSIELVHETLINAWPTLRRWFDDQAGDTALVADIGVAARRWEAAGRADGLLWRGEQANRVEAALRRGAELTAAESAFSSSVVRVKNRATRRRRVAFSLILVMLVAISAAATAAFLIVRKAEKSAKQSALAAARDADRARDAESGLADKVAALEAAERKRLQAESAADEASAEVLVGRSELAEKNKELARQLRKTKESEREAEEAGKKLAEKNKELRAQKKQIQKALENERRKRKLAERAKEKITEGPL